MVSMGLQKIEEGTSDDAFTEAAIRDTAGSIFTGKDGLLDSGGEKIWSHTCSGKQLVISLETLIYDVA